MSGTEQKAGMHRRGFLQLSGALTAAAVLAPALSSCAADDSGSDSSTLVLGFGLPIETLDNKGNVPDTQVTLHHATHEALTSIEADLTVGNALAESFDLTSPTEWTVKLRDTVYSDGSKVSIADVEAALAAYAGMAAGTSFVQTQFPEFPTVTAVDDLTFTLTTTTPNYALDRAMSNVLLMPAKYNKAENVDDAPGTGPFVVSSFDAGTGDVELKPNPKYRGTAPKVSVLKARYIPEASVRVSALRAGEIQVADTIAPDVAASLDGDADISIIRTEGTRLSHLAYNFRKSASDPLANPKVREALSYAVDGDTLINDLLLGSVTALKGVVPSTLIGAADVGSFQYDPERCKAMLAEAGVTNLSLRFIWENGEFYSISDVMEAVQQMMDSVGVKVELKEFQPGGDIGEWRQGKKGDWDVLGNGFGNQLGLAITDLQGMWAGTAEKEKERATYHGYVFPDVTAAINAAGAKPADQAVAELKTAQEMVWATWPAMWGFAQNNALAVRKGIKGITLKPINSYDLNNVTAG